MTRREFGRRLRKLRKGSGLSLRAVAGRLGFSHVYIYDLEKGYRLPSRETADKLSEILESRALLEDWFSVHITEAAGAADEWRRERARWRLAHMT